MEHNFSMKQKIFEKLSFCSKGNLEVLFSNPNNNLGRNKGKLPCTVRHHGVGSVFILCST